MNCILFCSSGAVVGRKFLRLLATAAAVVLCRTLYKQHVSDCYLFTHTGCDRAAKKRSRQKMQLLRTHWLFYY